MKTYSFLSKSTLAAVLFAMLAFTSCQTQKSSSSEATDEDVISPGPITEPMIVEIAPNTYFINEFGFDAMYVIEGKDRALVIDCGSRFCDLKSIVESLTSLPYDVAITHGHPDHAGGWGQFDEVYIHPADIEMARSISHEQEVEYGQIMYNMNIGYKDVWGYSKSDVQEFTKEPKINPLSDGQVFDLGDRKITTYFAPGHSPGSCTFLDPKTRILFSGDAANSNVGTNIPVSTTLRYLIRLKELSSEYDQMFTGHISYANTINVRSQKAAVLDDIIEAFRGVLRGDAELKEVANHLFPDRVQTRAIYGSAQVSFNPDKLWEEGEEQIIP